MNNNQIAIVHGTSSFEDEVIQITFRNHTEYALKHGYMLQEFRFDPNQGDKLWALSQTFKNPDILRAFWIDSDAIFTNPDLQLTNHLPEGKVIMPYDIFGPSADCLWMENTPEVRRLLWAASQVGAWAFEGHNPQTPHFKEKMGLRYLSLHPPYDQLFTYVEQTLMKSHLNEYYSDGRPNDNFGQWKPGDFILHLGGIPSAMKVSILEEKLHLSSANV